MRLDWGFYGALSWATLVSCGSSPPTHFFTLDAVAPAHEAPAQSDAPITIDAVHIPPVLDRQLMVRGERSNQLEISSQDRWAADFGEMARSVLTKDLARRLPPGSVIPPDMPSPSNARGLVVDILSFEPDAAGHVVLDADWTLLDGSPPRPVVRRSVHRSAAAGPAAHDQAATMSALLGRLADDIAAGVSGADPPR